MKDLRPDPTWLGIPEADTLRRIAGGLLAVSAVVAVLAVAVGAVTWALARVLASQNHQDGLRLIGRAVLGAVALATLSGVVGFLGLVL